MSAKKANANTDFKRIVVKFGTSLLTGGTDHLDEDTISALVGQVAALHKEGRQLIIVTSGAVAAGRHRLGSKKVRREMPFRQVLASVGQGRLMNVYDRLFSRYDITIGQALLTRTDLADRAGYLNARNTLLAMMELKVVGIVNENDVVAIDELQQDKFGENDNLSAMVANLVDADLLLILGDTAGLHTADPNRDPDARLITHVESFNEEIEKLMCGPAGEQGSGGITTKIEAARLATASGVMVIYADGREKDIILQAAAGEDIGTRFLPVGKLESRQRWMMSGLSTRGKIVVDSGAAVALKKNKRSLLAAGITSVEGKFQPGDVVNIYDQEGVQLGCGLTNYSASDVDIIKGVHTNKIATMLGCEFGSEVIHRNNLVVL